MRGFRTYTEKLCVIRVFRVIFYTYYPVSFNKIRMYLAIEPGYTRFILAFAVYISGVRLRQHHFILYEPSFIR